LGEQRLLATMKKKRPDGIIPVDEELPEVDKRVQVVCKDFRCLGYRDRRGVWRDANTSKELTEVIGWIDLFAG
jgi:hypothetical protein